MRIQHNIAAMNAYRNYNTNVSSVNKNLEKLSSGYRINRAGDDAAGLAISEKMRAQIKGLEAAKKNVKDGISFVKTAEGAMQEIQDMLGRMKYLATQSANGTYDSAVDRNNIQLEVDALLDEVDRIAQSANFNGIHMLNGPSADAEAGGDEGGEGGDALTAADITKPTATTATFADGTGSSTAKTEFDFAGVKFAKDGKVSVSFGGKAYDVDVTKDMTAAQFAEAFVTAYNDDKLTDAAAGAFTAEVDGTTDTKVVFTAATANTAMTTESLKTELAKAPVINPATTAPAGNAEGVGDAGGGNASAASFEVDLSGVSGVESGKTYTIQVGDDTNAKVESGETTGTDAAALAAAFNGKEVTVDEVVYTISNNGSKLVFTEKTPGTTAKTAVANNTGITLGKGATAATGNLSGDTGIKTANAKDGVAPGGDDGGDEGGGGGGGKTGNFDLTLQIGDSKGETIKLSIQSMSTASIGVSGLKTSGVKSRSAANTAIDTIKTAINTVSTVRGQLGAYQNRLEHTSNNLSVMTENIQDAESSIRDTDIADEMMAYTKNNILVQSAQAMLAQANQIPQGVLQLLG